MYAQDPGGDVDIACKVCLVAAGSLLLSEALKKAQPDYADAYLPRFAHAINTYGQLWINGFLNALPPTLG